MDLAAQHAQDLTEAERSLSTLVAADLGNHLSFRLIRSEPIRAASAAAASRDLVDLVVLVHTQSIDLGELRRAIDAEQMISDIEPFEHFPIPTDWTRTYPATANGVPIAESFSAATAALPAMPRRPPER